MEEFDIKNLMGLLGGTGGAKVVSQMNPITAGLQAIPAIYQLGLGIDQTAKANRLANSTVRPIMGVPQGQQNALAGAYNMAFGQAPGIGIAQQLMGQNNASTIAGIQNSGGGGAERMQALLGNNANAGLQAQQLAMQQQAFQQQMLMNLQNQQMQLAQTQKEQFDYNRNQPYQNIMDKAAQLRDSGPKNIQGGMTGLGGAIASAVGPMGGNAPLGGSPVDALSSRGPGSLMPDISQNSQRLGLPGEGEFGRPNVSLMPDISQRGMRDASFLSPMEQPSDQYDGAGAPDMTPLGGTQYNAQGEPVMGAIFDYNMGRNLMGGRPEFDVEAISKEYGGNVSPNVLGPAFGHVMRQLGKGKAKKADYNYLLK